MSKKNLVKYLLKDQPSKSSGISVSLKTLSEPCPLHWHNYIELELITDGNGEQLLNGKSHSLSRGSVSLIRLTDFHSLVPKGDISIINLSFDENLLNDDILSALTLPFSEICVRPEESDFEALESLSILCLKETEKTIPSKKYIKTLLNAVFIKLFEASEINCERLASEKTRLTPFRRSLEYLHSHFRENPSLSQIAEIAHYNPSHYSVVFHREMGENYLKYLNTLKLSYAKELLDLSDLKLIDICFECGFTSYANFLKTFKEKTGVSPSEYRERL